MLGNPGDGYHGKALAIPIFEFQATVTAEPAQGFVIHPNPDDGLRFPSLVQAAATFQGGGCDDALRLIRAGVKQFVGVTSARGGDGRSALDAGVSLRYETTIPRQVGLAGSSAIVIATLRALARRFATEVDPFTLSEAALRAEVDDLGIAAGPMDRVVQAYGQAVAMDLAPPRSPEKVTVLRPETVPPLFLAWHRSRTKNSGPLHAALRARWEREDPAVLDAVAELRDLVDQGVAALEQADHSGFGALMRRNFEIRTSIFSVTDADRALVEQAARLGCPAKLAGSGGAVIGLATASDEPTRRRAFESLGAAYLEPRTAEGPTAD